jgi:hypothetical protein
LAVAFQLAQALESFQPGWTAEVTVSFPANYQLDSFSIVAAAGSVSGFAGSFKVLSIDVCGGAGNTVSLTGAVISNSASVCSSGSASLQAVTLGSSCSVSLRSQAGSATVSVQGSYSGSFNVSSTSGPASVGLNGGTCLPALDYFQSKSGSCGSGAASVSVSGGASASFTDGAVPPPPSSAPVPSGTPSPSVLRWSDPATWPSGQVPQAGQDVFVTSDKIIMMDATTPELGLLEVQGTLISDPAADFWISAATIRVSGAIKVGAPNVPFTRSGRFTLTGAKTNYTSRAPLGGFTNDGISRSFRVESGATLELYGSAPATKMTHLNDHAAANATVLTLESTEGITVGSSVVISCTVLVRTCQSDLRTVVAVSGNTITIDTGLSYARWGKLQYPTDNGLSLTPGTFSAMRAHPDVADVLDERAVIIVLNRNIVIEGKNDTHWSNGHGVHVMWMGVTTKIQLDGVEVRRCGQAGALGRYCLHSHMLSYNMPDGPDLPSDGQFIGLASNVFIRNSAVHQSVNRAMVIHGTCGMKFHNNVIYNVLGHAIFLEDGSELMNEIIGNTVMNVRNPTAANALLKHDIGPGYGGPGPAGVWFANPNNTLKFNIFTDIRHGPGMWNAFHNKPRPIVGTITKPSGASVSVNLDRIKAITETWTLTAINSSTWSVVGSVSGATGFAFTGVQYSNPILTTTITGSVAQGDVVSIPVTQNYAGGCFGLSRRVRLFPFNTPTYDYSTNTAFSCRGPGALTDFFVIDEYGNTESDQFVAYNDSLPGQPYNDPKQVPHVFDRMILWMNMEGAYRNRIRMPLYKRWIVADNVGTDLAGATSDGSVERGLFIGLSLNNLEPSLLTDDRHCFATYHHSLAFRDLSFFNVPVGKQGPTAGYGLLNMPGPSESWDYYTSPVEMGTRKNTNWRSFNVSAFERTPPAHIETMYDNNAGGPDSTMSGIPPRRYWTLAGALYDNEGLLAGRHGDYLIFDYPFLTYNLTNSRRLSPNGKTLATSDKFGGIYVWSTDTYTNRYAYVEAITFARLDGNWQEYSLWQIKTGFNSSFFPNMRHAAVRPGGRYRIWNQDTTTPNSVRYNFVLYNANAANDTLIVAIPWSGSVAPAVHTGSTLNSQGRANSYDIDNGKARIYTEVGSRAALSTPNTFWRDTSTNQLWLSYVGGYTKHSSAIQDEQDIAFSVFPA